MKKLISLLLSFFAISLMAFSATLDDEDILLTIESENNTTRPRSVVAMPKASFSSQTSTVKLQITSQDGLAVVTVKDVMGIEICSQSIPANGTVQQFTLPNSLSTGIYYISIECNGAEYTGEFGVQ